MHQSQLSVCKPHHKIFADLKADIFPVLTVPRTVQPTTGQLSIQRPMSIWGTVILKQIPNTLNLDPNPGFWPNLDPNPVQGYNIINFKLF